MMYCVGAVNSQIVPSPKVSPQTIIRKYHYRCRPRWNCAWSWRREGVAYRLDRKYEVSDIPKYPAPIVPTLSVIVSAIRFIKSIMCDAHSLLKVKYNLLSK